MNAQRLILIMGMLVILSGCSAAAVAALDTAMTNINGDTCAMARILRGEAPCKPTEAKPEVVEEQLSCYRTLGVIDCYKAKDPFAKIEGRSPAEKQRVSSPSNNTFGNAEIVDGKRMPATVRPSTLRRSTPLVLSEAASKVDGPSKKAPKSAMKPTQELAKKSTPEAVSQPTLLPMAPVKDRRPPL